MAFASEKCFPQLGAETLGVIAGGQQVTLLPDKERPSMLCDAEAILALTGFGSWVTQSSIAKRPPWFLSRRLNQLQILKPTAG